jgi:subtilisin family serine protease
VLGGLDWAISSGADVINMSLGGLNIEPVIDTPYQRAILAALAAGIPIVAAIGNDGHQTTGSPGNDLYALAIGATDVAGRVAGFSGGRTQMIRRSSTIDERFLPLVYSKPELTAPGVDVYSCVPKGKWEAFNGTSMATPHVAGAIALLLSATSIGQKLNDHDRTAAIRDLLIATCLERGEAGQDHRFGYGLIDAFGAVAAARNLGY